MRRPEQSNAGSPVAGRSRSERARVVVVGSGFGGAVAACRLAQAGFEVVIVERGRRYESEDFPPFPAADQLLPDTRRWLWGPERGLWDVEDLGEIVSVTAAGYGGGSLIYANVHLRPPREVFREPWPTLYHERNELDGYFDLVASMLDVAPLPPDVSHPKTKLFDDAMRARKRSVFRPPLAISRQDGENAHGVRQRACNDCGACCTGCPVKAKNTLDLNYLAVAERHGARTLTQCEVTTIEQLEDDTWVVRYIDHFAAVAKELRAPYVFLCAGSTHSTRLLWRWEHARRAQRASDGPGAQQEESLIGVGFCPGGDAIGVVYDTREAARPSRGPTITSSVVQWQDAQAGRFFLLQDGGYPEQLARLFGLLRAPGLVGRNRVTRSPSEGLSREPSRPGNVERAEVPSMIDQLLDLGSSRLLAETLEGHRADFAKFVTEAQQALLLPAVVGRTIQLAIKQRYSRYRLTKWIPEGSVVMRWLVSVDLWLLRKLYGGAEALSNHAAESLLTAGGLSRAEVARRVLGYDDAGTEHRLMLLAMGRDAAPGLLEYDPAHDKLLADLDLYHLVPGYSEQERLMADVSKTLGGELRTNPAWSFLGKPITVHNQGGCPMSTQPDQGVTDENGKVHGVNGLYVMDGAVLCTSVGVNPSATIAAIAERNVLAFINAHVHDAGGAWPGERQDEGAKDYRRQKQRAAEWAARAATWDLEPPKPKDGAATVGYEAEQLGIEFREEMRGYLHPLTDHQEQPIITERDGTPRNHQRLKDDDYLVLERLGRPDHPLHARLKLSAPNLARFIEDERHRLWIAGQVRLRLPGEAAPVWRDVKGHLELFVPRRKPHALTRSQTVRREAHVRFTGTRYGAVHDDVRAPAPAASDDEQYMLYRLELDDSSGWQLTGHKRLSDKPGLQAWRDVSCLHVKLWRLGVGSTPLEVVAAGAIRVDMLEFLTAQVPSIQATGTDDPARRIWAAGRFATYFFGTLQRIYFSELDAALQTLFGTNSAKLERGLHSPYFTASSEPRDLGPEDGARARRERP